MYQRSLVQSLVDRMHEPRRFMQFVTGPRQTGKTTAVSQALEQLDTPSYYISADDALNPSRTWLENEWRYARLQLKQPQQEAILVIDEIQKIPGWSDAVKSLWDADSRNKANLKVIVTGSSTMLLRKGMEESLMGRFEVLLCLHWSYAECREAFGYSLDEYLLFGGFPGAAPLISDSARWLRYMETSIVEPTISQDVLAMESIRKPALLRVLFKLGANYSAQELSYTKMLGQLQDSGNTVTLAHYLDLLSKVDMLCGLNKYAVEMAKSKRSSPRFMVYDTSLFTYAHGCDCNRLTENGEVRGHLVESAVGARLLARSKEEGFEVHWWREGSREVDFVLTRGEQITAIEVKSGRLKGLGGMREFTRRHPEALALVVGTERLTLEEFLLHNTALFE